MAVSCGCPRSPPLSPPHLYDDSCYPVCLDVFRVRFLSDAFHHWSARQPILLRLDVLLSKHVETYAPRLVSFPVQFGTTSLSSLKQRFWVKPCLTAWSTNRTSVPQEISLLLRQASQAHFSGKVCPCLSPRLCPWLYCRQSVDICLSVLLYGLVDGCVGLSSSFTNLDAWCLRFGALCAPQGSRKCAA